MEENRRVHRIGTVTGGIVLIIYGVMFLLHTVFPIIGYRFIFRLWPMILIMLGLEILAGNAKNQKESSRFVYDFPAVILIILLILFAMAMGVIDCGIQNGAIWVQDGDIWIS